MKVVIDIPSSIVDDVRKYGKVSLCDEAKDTVISALDRVVPYEEKPEGAWVRTGQSFVNPNKFRNFCCSNCLFELDEHIRVEPRFCQNCGSAMRGTNV